LLVAATQLPAKVANANDSSYPSYISSINLQRLA
jgi:hypothetical protein